MNLYFAKSLCWSVVLINFMSCSHAKLQQITMNFDRAIPLEQSAENSANVSIGDVNNDGHLDIVLVKGRHWPLENQILLGRGSDTPSEPYPLDVDPDRSYSAILVDMDNDNDLDIVVSNDKPDQKAVYTNDGKGRYKKTGTFGKKKWPTRHILVDDLNGDGFPDAVLANRGGRKKTFGNYICFGIQGGQFSKDCLNFSEISATTIIAADVNADGRLDLAVPHRDGGQSYIYLGSADHRFETRLPFGHANAAIRSARSADLNRDGNLDIVIIDERMGPAVLWGGAKAAYSEPVAIAETQSARPYALEVADLDKDGLTDIIVGYVKSQPKVFFNKGNKTFASVSFGDDEGGAYGFAVGDINEDGFLDIAMARSGAKNMLYFGASTPKQ